jgi:hypothetical protein
MRSKANHKRSYAGFVGAQGGAPAAPVNTTLPSITGTLKVGETITIVSGVWSGKEPPEVSRQLLADEVPIPGAAGPTFLLTEAQEGKSLSVSEHAKNWKGSVSVTSQPTDAVEAVEEA